jgi:hypothetical protein
VAKQFIGAVKKVNNHVAPRSLIFHVSMNPSA